jgi:hypothetical protein
VHVIAWPQFVERVESEARQVKPGRLVLTLIAAVLYVVGWLIGWVFRGVWLVVSWSIAACKVGFSEARHPPRRDDG